MCCLRRVPVIRDILFHFRVLSLTYDAIYFPKSMASFFSITRPLKRMLDLPDLLKSSNNNLKTISYLPNMPLKKKKFTRKVTKQTLKLDNSVITVIRIHVILNYEMKTLIL